jgi:foldase protein PrsA
MIGGTTITYGQLQQRLIDKYGAELINLMVDREAIRQEAEELSVTVSREEMDAELKRMQQGYDSEEQFYQSMKEQLNLSKQELNEDMYYKLLLEHLAIRGIQVSEADVNAYIKNHPDEFSSFVQYHLYKIEVKTRDEANKLINDLRNGADFSSLAQKQSIDTASGKKGGDMGWIEEKDPFIPPAILEAARGLKPGEISKALPMNTGFAVILMKELKETKKTVDEPIRAHIRKELALQKASPLNDVIKALRVKRHAEIVDPELR